MLCHTNPKLNKRIKNNPQAKDLLLEMSNGFDILHEKISKDSTLSAIGNALPDMMWAKDSTSIYYRLIRNKESV